MKYRTWEKAGIAPSLLGFGCMRFPLREDGTIDKEQTEKMLDLAMEEGVTYIDTAYPYLNGQSEVFMGEYLKKYERETKETGYTIIPIRLYINEKGLAKLEIAIAKGKKAYDEFKRTCAWMDEIFNALF